MSYICTDWQRYEHGSRGQVGNGQCAVFVEKVTGAPMVHDWRPGLKVLGNGHLIPAGTAIATFNSSRVYPNMNHGNHAALFVSENGHEIKVIDQWHGKHNSHLPGPSSIHHLGGGNDHNMSGDPNFYYVVE